VQLKLSSHEQSAHLVTVTRGVLHAHILMRRAIRRFRRRRACTPLAPPVPTFSDRVVVRLAQEQLAAAGATLDMHAPRQFAVLDAVVRQVSASAAASASASGAPSGRVSPATGGGAAWPPARDDGGDTAALSPRTLRLHTISGSLTIPHLLHAAGPARAASLVEGLRSPRVPPASLQPQLPQAGQTGSPTLDVRAAFRLPLRSATGASDSSPTRAGSFVIPSPR
jgi:hypothetical protein